MASLSDQQIATCSWSAVGSKCDVQCTSPWSLPLVSTYSHVPPPCTMYTSMHLHPFNTSYQAYLVCTSYPPCTMSVSQVCSLAPGKAAQFLLRGTAADYSLMSLLSLSDKSPPLASSLISHDSSLCKNLQCRKYEQFVGSS